MKKIRLYFENAEEMHNYIRQHLKEGQYTFNMMELCIDIDRNLVAWLTIDFAEDVARAFEESRNK